MGIAAGHRAAGLPYGIGFLQKQGMVSLHQRIIYAVLVPPPAKRRTVSLLQKPVGDQKIHVDEIRATRKGAGALVGAVGTSGGANGQNLPHMLACRLQKLQKVVSRLAQTAHAPPAGQRKNGQQNAGSTAQIILLHGWHILPCANPCRTGSTVPHGAAQILISTIIIKTG